MLEFKRIDATGRWWTGTEWQPFSWHEWHEGREVVDTVGTANGQRFFWYCSDCDMYAEETI